VTGTQRNKQWYNVEDVEFWAAQNIIHCCCWRMSLWTCMHTCDCCLCSSNCSELVVIVFCFYLFLLELDFSSFTCFPESLQLLLGWWGIHYYFSLIKVLCMEACRQICNGGALHHEEEGFLPLIGLYCGGCCCCLEGLLGWWGVHYYFSLIKVLCMEAFLQIHSGGCLAPWGGAGSFLRVDFTMVVVVVAQRA
jgi:hypothetical protein